MIEDPVVDTNLVLTDYDRKVAQKKKILEPMSPRKWAETIGLVSLQNLSHSPYTEFTEALRNRAKEPYNAQNVFYALFLARDKKNFEIQYNALKPMLSPEALIEVQENYDSLAQLDPNFIHLAVMNLCLPSLKSFSNEQFVELAKNIKVLCEADQRLSLLEYASFKLIKNYRQSLSKKKVTEFFVLEGVKSDVLILLSAIAYASSGQTSEAADAFQAGTNSFGSSQIHSGAA